MVNYATLSSENERVMDAANNITLVSADQQGPLQRAGRTEAGKHLVKNSAVDPSRRPREQSVTASLHKSAIGGVENSWKVRGSTNFFATAIVEFGRVTPAARLFSWVPTADVGR